VFALGRRDFEMVALTLDGMKKSLSYQPFVLRFGTPKGSIRFSTLWVVYPELLAPRKQ
jgi:hypothetical protein